MKGPDISTPRPTTHPLWATLNLLILMGAFCFVLWLNATKFDSTEVSALIEAGIIIGIREFFTLKGRSRNGESSDD